MSDESDDVIKDFESFVGGFPCPGEVYTASRLVQRTSGLYALQKAIDALLRAKGLSREDQLFHFSYAKHMSAHEIRLLVLGNYFEQSFTRKYVLRTQTPPFQVQSVQLTEKSLAEIEVCETEGVYKLELPFFCLSLKIQELLKFDSREEELAAVEFPENSSFMMFGVQVLESFAIQNGYVRNREEGSSSARWRDHHLAMHDIWIQKMSVIPKELSVAKFKADAK